MLEMDNLQSIQAILCCAVYSIRSPIGISLWFVLCARVLQRATLLTVLTGNFLAWQSGIVSNWAIIEARESTAVQLTL
jgi:hypothetical protein